MGLGFGTGLGLDNKCVKSDSETLAMLLNRFLKSVMKSAFPPPLNVRYVFSWLKALNVLFF